MQETLSQRQAFAGVPSILSEVGEDGKLDSKLVDVQYKGILNVMKSLGIWEGKVEERNPPMVSHRGKFLLAKRGGVFYSYVQTGETVRENQLIGEIKSLKGESLEEIRPEFDSVVLAIVNNPSVKKSDITYELLAISNNSNR